MSGNGRVLTPGAVNVSATYADGPLAQPSSVVLQNQGEMRILVCGGLTKVEALAGQIAAGLLTARDSSTDDAWIVDRAEAILAECASRRAETAKETP